MGRKSLIYSSDRHLITLGGLVLENYGKSFKEPFWENVFDAAQEPALQQFTGLKDKNGKEIYEGDIIKYDPFNIKEHKNSIVKVYDLRAFHWWHELEQMLEMKNKCNIQVIGNIFENPELLK